MLFLVAISHDGVAAERLEWLLATTGARFNKWLS